MKNFSIAAARTAIVECRLRASREEATIPAGNKPNWIRGLSQEGMRGFVSNLRDLCDLLEEATDEIESLEAEP